MGTPEINGDGWRCAQCVARHSPIIDEIKNLDPEEAVTFVDWFRDVSTGYTAWKMERGSPQRWQSSTEPVLQ